MSTRERIVAAGCAISFVLALVAVVWRSGFLLTNDTPALLFNGVVASSLDDPRFAPFFVEHPRPTFHGFSEIVGVAAPALGWRAAHQLALCIIVALTALGAGAVVWAMNARNWPVAIAAGVLGLQHCLYLGLVQYQLAFALGCFAIAWCLRRRRRHGEKHAGRHAVRWHAVLSLLLLASAAAHPFGAMFAGVVCFALVVTTSETIEHAATSQGRVRAALWMIVAGAPSALVALAASDVTGGGAAYWPSVDERVALVLGVVPGPAWRGALLWIACLGGVACAVQAMRAARAAGANEANEAKDAKEAKEAKEAKDVPVVDARERVVVVAVVAALGISFLILGAAGPRDLLGWQLFGLRPLPFAATLLLAAVDVDVLCGARAASRPPGDAGRPTMGAWIARIVTGAALVYVAATLAWTARFHDELRGAMLPLLTRVEQLEPAPALRATISAQPRPPLSVDVPLWAPFRRVGSLATLELGGGVWGYYGRATDALALRAPPPGTSPSQEVGDRIPPAPGSERDDYVRRLAALSISRGALFASATPRDLDVIEEAGWHREQRIDPDAAEVARLGSAALGVMAARFVGCAAEVRAHTAGAMQVGFMPMNDPSIIVDVGVDVAVDVGVGVDVDVDLGVAGAAAPAETIDGLGCGAMWFRFASPCANADASGRVHATLTRSHAVEVRCVPP